MPRVPRVLSRLGLAGPVVGARRLRERIVDIGAIELAGRRGDADREAIERPDGRPAVVRGAIE